MRILNQVILVLAFLGNYKKTAWNCVLFIVFEGPEKNRYAMNRQQTHLKPAQEQSMPFLCIIDEFLRFSKTRMKLTFYNIILQNIEARTFPCFDGKFNDKEWKQEKDWKSIFEADPQKINMILNILTLCILSHENPVFRPITHPERNTRVKIHKCQVISIIPKRTSFNKSKSHSESPDTRKCKKQRTFY